jgi:hypothetical protein
MDDGHSHRVRRAAPFRPGTRGLPYRARRALLEELRLEGPAWRTPRVFAIDEDLAAVTRERHLEGVVAKRLDAPYHAGRRGVLWLKYKHRHRERLTVTAWRPGGRREPDEVLVSRSDREGRLRYADVATPDALALLDHRPGDEGPVEQVAQREVLRALAALPPRQRRALELQAQGYSYREIAALSRVGDVASVEAAVVSLDDMSSTRVKRRQLLRLREQ